MDSKQSVVLVTDDPETATVVAAALESTHQIEVKKVCRNLQQVIPILERTPTTGVLVDIDPNPAKALSELDPVISKFPNVRFIALTENQKDDLVLEAMQVGVRHLLRKESIAPEFAGALHRVLPRDSAMRRKQGAAITLLAASGGCGSTTLAINLANEIHLASSEPVLLVDLDYCYGAVGSYLGIEAQYGIENVLADAGRIDAQLVNSTASTYSDGLHTLVSPVTTNNTDPGPLRYEHLDTAVEACRHAYSYTVIDAPRLPPRFAARLAKSSVITLIVLQLNVKDIRSARHLLSALAEHGGPADRIVPLVNRYQKRRSMITLKEAQDALGGVRFECVSNDYRNVMRGINFGQPLAQVAPRSALRRDLRKLAAGVCSADSNHSPVAASR